MDDFGRMGSLMQENERIGRVLLDYSHYQGKDLYSDGEVEDELLDIVQNHSQSEYGRIIEERATWPILYHLSEQRGNIVEWIPMDPNAKVLEVGSGCGAITGTLSAKAREVDCVDLSKKRSLVNAYRNKNCENVTIHVGNFRDIEPSLPRDYQYIFLIGVFEYGQAYIGTDHPYENFLHMLQKHLAPVGRIVIAIENRLGLKYFAGCKEDHLGSWFSGIEGYEGTDVARTFSRDALIKIMKNCGVDEYHFYYPYPDYKFMSVMHSDLYYPRPGEFRDNVFNFDRDRLVLFNEKHAYDSLIEDRNYPNFANSFEVIIGPGFPVIYTKFSNDRAPEFQIRTDIAADPLGRLQVHKYPLTLHAREHIRSIRDAYLTLVDRYRGGDLSINDCTVDDRTGSATFSFVNGVPLSTLMDRCISSGEIEKFAQLFKEYIRRISYREDYPAADYDLVFSNIIVNGPIWTVIDYEWTYGKKIPTREIAFRALYSYLEEDAKRRAIHIEKFYDYLGLTKENIATLLKEEQDFQKYVTGARKSLVEIHQLIGKDRAVPKEITDGTTFGTQKGRIQIYQDFGEGFSEENSYFPKEQYNGRGQVKLNLSLKEGTKAIRLDPAFSSCIVTLSRIVWNGEKTEEDGAPFTIKPNGAWLSDESIVFDTEDPNIEIRLNTEKIGPLSGNVISILMMMSLLPQEIAANLVRYQMEGEEEGAGEKDREEVALEKGEPGPSTVSDKKAGKKGKKSGVKELLLDDALQELSSFSASIQEEKKSLAGGASEGPSVAESDKEGRKSGMEGDRSSASIGIESSGSEADEDEEDYDYDEEDFDEEEFHVKKWPWPFHRKR